MESFKDKNTLSKSIGRHDGGKCFSTSIDGVEIHASAEREQKMTLLEGLKLYPKAVWWSVFISTAVIMEGYDIGLLGSFYGFPAFQKKFTIANPGFTVPTTSTFSLKFTNATGLFSGTVTQPTVNTLRQFNGVLFQKTRTGAGLFKATAPKTGYIEIAP